MIWMPPVVTLNGDNPQIIDLGDAYTKLAPLLPITKTEISLLLSLLMLQE